MDTKLSRVLAALREGRGVDALRVAARFPRIGPPGSDFRKRITKGWEAHAHPRFYKDLGHDVDALVRDGVAAMRELWGDLL